MIKPLAIAALALGIAGANLALAQSPPSSATPGSPGTAPGTPPPSGTSPGSPGTNPGSPPTKPGSPGKPGFPRNPAGNEPRFTYHSAGDHSWHA